MREQLSDALDKLTQKLNGWFDQIVLLLPNLLIAAIVLGLSILLARLVHKYVNKLTNRFTHNETISSVMSSVATAVFMLLSIFLILSILNLDQALTSLLAGAGVIGLAVGLALQDPLINLFSGVMMSVRDLFHLGDLVETNDYFGTIKKIDLRSTRIELPTGELVTMPNKDVLQSPLKNFTASGKRRIIIECGISYGDDLDQVEQITKQTLSQLTGQSAEEIEFYYTSFGDSSINFLTRYWIKEVAQTKYLKARSQAMIAIKKAFDANDIMIPFPIRTLDFGIRGGEKLDSMLSQRFSQNGNGQEKHTVPTDQTN
jgi:small conductance mechanosensitive channel